MGEILLTKELDKALEYLGYDNPGSLKNPTRFQTDQDCFNYIISSPYFCKELFNPETFKKNNKVRFTKRKGFKDFVEFVQQLPDPSIQFVIDKYQSRKTALELFGKTDEYMEFCEKHEITKLHTAKKKIVVEMLRREFKLAGKELGSILTQLKNNNDDFLTIDVDFLYEQAKKLI